MPNTNSSSPRRRSREQADHEKRTNSITAANFLIEDSTTSENDYEKDRLSRLLLQVELGDQIFLFGLCVDNHRFIFATFIFKFHLMKPIINQGSETEQLISEALFRFVEVSTATDEIVSPILTEVVEARSFDFSAATRPARQDDARQFGFTFFYPPSIFIIDTNDLAKTVSDELNSQFSSQIHLVQSIIRRNFLGALELLLPQLNRDGLLIALIEALSSDNNKDAAEIIINNICNRKNPRRILTDEDCQELKALVIFFIVFYHRHEFLLNALDSASESTLKILNSKQLNYQMPNHQQQHSNGTETIVHDQTSRIQETLFEAAVRRHQPECLRALISHRLTYHRQMTVLLEECTKSKSPTCLQLLLNMNHLLLGDVLLAQLKKESTKPDDIAISVNSLAQPESPQCCRDLVNTILTRCLENTWFNGLLLLSIALKGGECLPSKSVENNINLKKDIEETLLKIVINVENSGEDRRIPNREVVVTNLITIPGIELRDFVNQMVHGRTTESVRLVETVLEEKNRNIFEEVSKLENNERIPSIRIKELLRKVKKSYEHEQERGINDAVVAQSRDELFK